MLSIKTNKNNCKLSYIELDVNNITTGSTRSDDVTVNCQNHNIRENDKVVFNRKDGSTISFFEEFAVNKVIDSNNFTITIPNSYTLGVVDYKPTWIKYTNGIFANQNYTTVKLDSSDTPLIISDSHLTQNNIGILGSDVVSIKIGSDVDEIDSDTFNGCVNLSEIDIDVFNNNYTTINNVLFTKDRTKLVHYPSNLNSKFYVIPDTVNEIIDYAFYGNEHIELVSAHQNIEIIGNFVFENCTNLKYFVCRNSNPPTIGNMVFDNTNATFSIYVPNGKDNLYRIVWENYINLINNGDITFILRTNNQYTVKTENSISLSGANVKTVEIGTNVTEISSLFFPLTNKVSFYGAVPNFNESIFEPNNYMIHVPNELIDEYKNAIPSYTYRVFCNNDLENNTILYASDRVFVITGDTIEHYDNITDVYIGPKIKEIADFAFNGCQFETIIIPDNVERIGKNAFLLCIKLKKIVIGRGIKRIGDNAFSGIGMPLARRSDTDVYCLTDTPPRFDTSEAFTIVTPNGHKTNIYVSSEKLNEYKGIYNKPLTTTSNSEIQYLCLALNTPHIYTINRDAIEIRRKYLWDGEKYTYTGAITMCTGDYYLYNNIFLVQNINNSDIELLNIDYLTITAITYNGVERSLTNCLIGVNNDGNDDRYHVYVPYEGNEDFINNIEEIFHNATFLGDDVRFLYGDNRVLFGEELQPNTVIEKVCGDIEIDFSIGDNFGVNLFNYEQINGYVEKVKEESINKIIDYERRQFVPMYYTGTLSDNADEYFKTNPNEIDNNLKPINKIKFHLCFREKDYIVYEDENGNVDSVDFGSWETNDDGYWNNYTISDDLTKLTYVYDGKRVYGDLLGYLGFTDDDVYYQKDALKKSFLRLSFYDSPYRETQKLLYYSTIYFDSNNLSKNYIKDLNCWRKESDYNPKYNQLVFDGEISTIGGQPLTAEMICANKYNNTMSSDGFYLYLFDKLVNGNTCTPIYMKAEFNNAKFGKVVPLIYPVYKDNNERIAPTNTSFPKDYSRTGLNDGQMYGWVDMESFLQDMYIKIYIKYDFNTNEYVWFLPTKSKENSDVLTFELFEPRLYSYNEPEYIDYTPKWFDGEFYKEEDGENSTYVWFRNDNDEHIRYSEFGSEHTTKWPDNEDCCCLMTTAITSAWDSKVVGPTLFNKIGLTKIKSIWIDGMMVYSEDFYDKVNEKYKTTQFQLPDGYFSAHYISNTGSGQFLWQPSTTQEVWNDTNGVWEESSTVTPKIIHSVNYYFKDYISDTHSLLLELSNGIYNPKKHTVTTKTKEAKEATVSILTNAINANGNILLNGLFNNIRSLKSVKTIVNGNKYFSVLGNGAFNNCQYLDRVDIEFDSVDIIGKNCFSGCRALKTVKLTNTKVILREAFQGCYTLRKTYYTVGPDAGTLYIASGAFGFTAIREVAIPSTVIRISNSAFRRCYKLENFYLSKNGNIQHDYLYGPDVIFRNSEVINGNTDLYTFTNQSQECQIHLQTIGKRLFAENTILKYNLGYNGEGKYTYNSGLPQIIIDLMNNGVRVEFYNNITGEYDNLNMTPSKDRGKLLYHFMDQRYLNYLTEKQYDVYNFEKWYKNIF